MSSQHPDQPATLQDAFNALGVQLFRMLQPGELRVVCSIAMVHRSAEIWIQVFGPDGDQQSAEGTFRIVAPTTELATAAGWLRRHSYEQDRGTWFTAQVRVGADGAASIRTWPNDPPRIDDIEPIAWLEDLEAFPRSPEHIPAWLAERVDEARRARDAQDGWSAAVALDLGGVKTALSAEDTDDEDETGRSAGGSDADPDAEHDAEPDFLSLIRDAVDADPTDLSLRISLVELLLERSPQVAQLEIEKLPGLGANAQTVMVLRARAAAALARRRPQEASPTPASASAPLVPGIATTPGAPAAPAATGHAPTPAPPSDAEPIAAAVGSDDEGAPVWDVERPSVTLADVAGLTEVKAHLEASFLAPMRNPEMARLFGKAPRGSLLMYGPPGCGKTFIARAIAGELGASFVHATLADLMGQYFGESEKAIHALFETARASRPCVIFIDEFDAIGGRRTSASSPSAQALRMVTSQLLEEFDGVDASNDGIYVLAATNRPWDVDPALRRPGRLDRTVLILPPDAPAREAIIRIGLRDKPAADIDATELAGRTEQFSGADLAYVVDSAIERAFMESLASGIPRMITTFDLDAAASQITPSTRSWFEQIKPVLEYGVDDGTFAQLRSYLKQHRI